MVLFLILLPLKYMFSIFCLRPVPVVSLPIKIGVSFQKTIYFSESCMWTFWYLTVYFWNFLKPNDKRQPTYRVFFCNFFGGTQSILVRFHPGHLLTSRVKIGKTSTTIATPQWVTRYITGFFCRYSRLKISRGKQKIAIYNVFTRWRTAG